MYPYHNKIKQRIAAGQLVGYAYVDAYKGISPCLLLYFRTEPVTRPIRAHRFAEYEKILKPPNRKNNQISRKTTFKLTKQS